MIVNCPTPTIFGRPTFFTQSIGDKPLNGGLILSTSPTQYNYFMKLSKHENQESADFFPVLPGYAAIRVRYSEGPLFQSLCAEACV